MASILDLGLIDQFSSVFAVIFIFLIIYAVLEVTKILGQNPGVHGLIALLIALMSATQPSALKVISNFSPFYVVFIMFLVFLFMAASFSGFKPDEVIAVIGGKQGGAVVFLIVTIVIMAFALSGVYGQSFLESFSKGNSGNTGGNITGSDTSTGSFSQNFGATLFHPKILGMILIMLIGTFAIALLTSGPRLPGM
ncbi:MAG: hypothetical protein AABX51_00820 [Nanoarchaeota archaeon]|mgnify:CR=1 FL=1